LINYFRNVRTSEGGRKAPELGFVIARKVVPRSGAGGKLFRRWRIKKGKTMKNKAVKIGIVASILPHLFCCVLPIVLSLIGLFAPEVAHTSFIPESVEPWIFVFSAMMLLLSWFLVWRDCPCAECESEKSHKTQKIILSVITVVFILSILLHIFAHS